jgi:hypothetical protein
MGWGAPKVRWIPLDVDPRTRVGEGDEFRFLTHTPNPLWDMWVLRIRGTTESAHLFEVNVKNGKWRMRVDLTPSCQPSISGRLQHWLAGTL